MAKQKTYTVKMAFGARGKDGRVYWIDTNNGHRVAELLPQATIDAHVAAGDLLDEGAETDAAEERAAATADGAVSPAMLPPESAEDETTRKSRGKSR